MRRLAVLRSTGRPGSRPVAFVALVVLAALVAYGSVALATPGSGVTSATVAKGRFGDIQVKAKTDIDPGTRTDFWQAAIDTKGSSDLEIVQNTIVPGGTFGWHSHPGPSLVIVKSGTATFYRPAPRTWSRPDRVSWTPVQTSMSCEMKARSTS